jgi:2-amino-4-hydroxy-6-hydroxymethyldihydropteridine diphosphokinase
MPEVFIGVGSNADPVRALREAVAALGRYYPPPRCSSVYRSSAAGVAAADYLNMAVAFTTEVGVATLLEQLAAIEDAAGRSRADPAVCRLDLDLLLYGCRVDAAQRLPRPGLFELAFVLGPLAELAPELVHPLTGARCRNVWLAMAPASSLENLGALAELG